MLQVTERGTGALAIRDTVPLTPDTIRKYIPGVFATYHDGKRSQEYDFVPTSRVIEALDGVGFEPFAAKRAGVRSKEARSSKLPYVRHEIRFRKKGEKIAAVGGTLRELILGNSHNGTSTSRSTPASTGWSVLTASCCRRATVAATLWFTATTALASSTRSSRTRCGSPRPASSSPMSSKK